jgi:endogenous inhibitor of DNA gyrase (YacG/DUF329 family)
MGEYIIRFPKRTNPRDPQPLGFIDYPTCDKCGEKVKWRIKKTYRMADGKHLREYLVCPVCGARATRITDIPAK